MRIRIGTNFKSDDVPELELVAGSNAILTATQTTAELAQVTIAVSAGAGTGSSPWSTTLATSLAVNATTMAITTPLPIAGLITTAPDEFVVVIDAFTPNAEVRPVRKGVDDLHLQIDTSVGNLLTTHAAGAVIIFVQEALYAQWFGLRSNGLTATDVTGQGAALNRMCSQGRQYGWPLLNLGEGGYSMDASTVVIGYSCTFDFAGGHLAWLAANDVGAGNLGLDAITGTGTVTIKDPLMTGPAANAATGNLGVDPACMDGLGVTNFSVISGVRGVITNFRNGLVESGFNHATIDGFLNIQHCYYGKYRVQGGGNSGGDNSVRRLVSSQHRMACVAVGPNQEIAAEDYYDCHFYGAPVGILFESGSHGGAPGLYRCSFESLGNAAIMTLGNAACGAGSYLGTTCTGWNNAVFGIPSLPFGVFCNNSGGDVQLGLSGDFTAWALDPSQITTGISLFNGPSRWILSPGKFDLGGLIATSWNQPIMTSAGPMVALLDREFTYTAGATEFAWGDGCFGITTTPNSVKRGDLLEYVYATNQNREYQTSGAPPFGVALEPDPGIGSGSTDGAFCIARRGVCMINVLSTNSIAAGSWLKPDASNNGMVVAASSFSDGPIVGYALAAASPRSRFGSSKVVQAQLMVA